MNRSLGDVEDDGAAAEWIVRSAIGLLGQLAVLYSVDSLGLDKEVETYRLQLFAVERHVLRYNRQRRVRELHRWTVNFHLGLLGARALSRAAVRKQALGT